MRFVLQPRSNEVTSFALDAFLAIAMRFAHDKIFGVFMHELLVLMECETTMLT
jgi:hypothetical protein